MNFSKVFHVRQYWVVLALAVLGVASQSLSNAQVPVAAEVVTADLYPQRRISFPDGVTGLPDLRYATISGYRPLTLDLYLPPDGTGGGAHPFVMYVHGGGWSGGNSRNSGAFENFPEVLASIAARGYVVASINYRLSGEEPFPSNIQDVKSAIRWLRTNAEEYGIDKSRGVVWGPSAGGHLAALAAMSCGVEALEPAVPGGRGRGAPPAEAASLESDCVQGLVAWYGLFDFETARFPPGVFGCAGSDCDPELLRLASPVDQVDPSDPPVLIIHGELDQTIPVEQAREFYRVLQENNVQSELIVVPGVGHSYIGENHQATSEASNFGLQKTIDFIDATIGPQD